MVQNYIHAAIEQHQLPHDFVDTVSQWYAPLAHQVASLASQTTTPLVLGVQGTQGSGKSTLADFLTLLLAQEHSIGAVSLSIDDFYLTRFERQQLSEQVHPLFATRGVPGTHDTELALGIITQLKALQPGQALPIPRFNKAIDDRAPKSLWPIQQGPVQVIILEGWCVGLSAQPGEVLQHPVNELESEEDSAAVWRTYVNNQLENAYDKLFNTMDALVVLKAPSFECVYEWRLLQEQKLAKALANASEAERSKLLSPAQVKRFISHYQRLTEHALQTLPGKADWLLELNSDHKITSMRSRETHE